MMYSEKRKRSANWAPSEKSLLVDLVTEHFHIIEFKRTDVATMKQKSAEWMKISEEYNSHTGLGHSHRTAENLKGQWESLKKAAKKEAASKRLQLMQSGAGSVRPKLEDPLQERILLLVMPELSIHNPYDSDITQEDDISVSSGSGAFADGPEVQTEASIGATTPAESTDAKDHLMKHNDTSPVYVPTDEPYPPAHVTAVYDDRTKTDRTAAWNYTPQASTKQLQNGGNRPDWRRRRLQTQDANLKLLRAKALDQQILHATREREEARELFTIQREIQQEILKQERLKSRLLLLELRSKKKKL